MSLANHALSFRHIDSGFVAVYHVELVVRADSVVVFRRVGDQTVRVRTFNETLRVDESIVYQQMFALQPGIYSASVMVRDRNSPAYAEAQIVARITIRRRAWWADRDVPGRGAPAATRCPI
jgi:hypothetical protein